MTQSEYEAELHFRLCKSIFATLAIRGIIGEDDLRIGQTTPVKQNLSLEEVRQLAGENHAVYTRADAKTAMNIDQYAISDKALLTQAEMDSLRTERAKAATLSIEQALEDTDLFFRTWKYSYPSYYFMGEELFTSAQKKVVANLSARTGTITGKEFGDILYEAMSFLQDDHSSIDGKSPAEYEDNLFYVSYLDNTQVFMKDETGYYQTINGAKWYFTSSSSIEEACLYLRTIENSVVIGTNTKGCSQGGSVQTYYLPYSGVPFAIGGFMKFQGEAKNIDGLGYEPDIWCNPSEALTSALMFLQYYGLADQQSVQTLYRESTPPADLRILWHGSEILPGQGFGRIPDRGDDNVLITVDGKQVTDFTVTSNDPATMQAEKVSGGKIRLTRLKSFGGKFIGLTIRYDGKDYGFACND